MSLLDRLRTDVDGPNGEPLTVGARITTLSDLALVSAVELFAVWTLFCLAALAGLIPSGVAFWAWVASAPLIVAVSVPRLRVLLGTIPAPSPWPALLLSAGAGAGALVVVRPDLDDAYYVARSTWIAANGDVRVGDVIFSDGAWPGLQPGTPYLPSIEALLGWVARVSGASAGTVVYVAFAPLAAAGAMWALWMLLRAWRVRRPAWALALATVFLLWGGSTHASWGNLHFARIWQGKVTFLALLVPLIYVLAAAFWTARSAVGRRAALAVLVLAGIAGVGLTPAAIFVVPAVALAALVPGLVQRRWRAAALMFAASAGPAVVAGAVNLFAREGGGSNPSTGEDPWRKVLGAGLPAVVVVVAAVIVVLGCLWTRHLGGADAVGRWTALGSVVIGALVAVPMLFAVAVAVMGTDEIAWRLTWVVPLPAIVGLLAALPRWSSWMSPGIPAAVVTAAALIWAGLPVWSPTNGAWVTSSVAWKIAPAQLEAARWVADRAPEGRVLAPVQTAAAIGVVTAEVAPVGSRPTYMEVYVEQPGALMDQRILLQRLADLPPRMAADPADLRAAPAALAALDVQIACVSGAASPLEDVAQRNGYAPAFANAEVSCLERTAAA